MRNNPELYRKPSFREIDPIPQWSMRIAVDMPHADFIEGILAAAEITQHRYTGTLTHDPLSGNVTSFTRTRFPRKKYGHPPRIEECEAGMLYLADMFNTVAVRDSQPSGMSRIVLGLYEGQHATGDRSTPDGPDYSVEGLQLQLGSDFTVSPAEVLAVRLGSDGSASRYSEPVGEIVFSSFRAYKQRVYDLGYEMGQERFSVEDFDQTVGQSYMVETAWCREPDPT